MLKGTGFGKVSFSAALALALLVPAGEGRADLLGDTIKPFASVNETYDSNIFRAKDPQQVKAMMGDDRMGDFITTSTVGSAFHYGLSSLQANILLKRDFLNYIHYTSQNGSRDEADADASIRLFDRVTVKVDEGYLREPEARTDFRSPGQNEMTTLQYGILVGYEMKCGLAVQGGYRRISVGYSLKELQPNEYDLDRYTGTVSYRLSPQSKVYTSYQHDNRNYREGMRFGDAAVKSDNTGDSVRVGVERELGQKTSFSGNVGYETRKHDALPGRDFSGPVGKAELRYAVTSKLGVVANGERALYEETYPDQIYSVNTSVGAGVEYQATSKLKATVLDKVSWKDFQSVPGAQVQGRKDVTNTVSAGLEWTPRDKVSVTIGYRFENRGSSDSSYKYSSHAVTAGVGCKF